MLKLSTTRKYSRSQSPALTIGISLTLFVVALALFSNLVTSQDPFKSVALPFQAPSSEHLLGTDDLGRSIFAGIIHGAKTSLLVGFIVASVSLLIGIVVGAVAGFYGGWVDDILMRFTELILILPRFFLALMVVALFGPSLTNLILVLALTTWGFTARITRAGVLSARELEYVMAARSLGRTELANLFCHVLPNVITPVTAYGALLMGNAILIEAGLSFLGLGDPNVMSWGYMLNNAQTFIRRAWWMSVFPGLAIAVTVLGINLLSDGISKLHNSRRGLV